MWVGGRRGGWIGLLPEVKPSIGDPHVEVTRVEGVYVSTQHLEEPRGEGGWVGGWVG